MTGSETNSIDYPDLAEASIKRLQDARDKIVDIQKGIKVTKKLLDDPPKCQVCGFPK